MADQAWWMCMGCGRTNNASPPRCSHCDVAASIKTYEEMGWGSQDYCMRCGAITWPEQSHQCRMRTDGTNGGSWVCQKCGRSYGPHVLECRPCNTLIERGPRISSGANGAQYPSRPK